MDGELKRDDSELGPCPQCRKPAGKVRDAGAGRFPWFVQCGSCGWATEHVRNEGVAVKMWNEAKPEAEARG